MSRATVWRALLARIPLPMLALAASYGVYSFNRLFVPVWVALVSAAAFELTYVGLAVWDAGDAAQRHRARAISLGAVGVSVIYNTLAGLAHRAPDVFDGLPRTIEIALALLHGAPLAIVAFLVADLLLHAHDARTAHAHDARTHPAQIAHNARTRIVRAQADARTERAHAHAHDARAQALAALQAGASVAEVARHYQINPSTLRSWRARAAAHAPAAD